ncbi:MAG: RES domain-containing protein [Deltaproteobacteria bacterium]|nr:RES domain-containing protein [Deltaproteobacteria bacterium]
MIAAWRIVKTRHAADAFSGEGARLYGGRWNHRGTSVVYAADSLALAALEQFMHLAGKHVAIRFVCFRIDVPDAVNVDVLPRGSLPRNWRREPAPDETKDLGTAWVRRGAAAVLRVPSVVVPVEHDFVLNPGHPDFTRLRLSKPQPFTFDPRMWK